MALPPAKESVAPELERLIEKIGNRKYRERRPGLNYAQKNASGRSHHAPASPLPPPLLGSARLECAEFEVAPTDPLRSGFELSLAPFQRGAQSFLARKLPEPRADLGLRGIERRGHVDAGLHRVAKSGGVGTAIDGELGSGERFGGDQRHASGKFQRVLG